MSLNKLTTSSKKSLLIRTITGIILLGVLFPVSVFGDWPYFILIFLLAVVAIHEILNVPGPNKYNPFVKGIVYVFSISFIYWGFLKNMLADSSFNPFLNGGHFMMVDIYASITAILIFALVLFFIAIVDHRVQLQDVTYLFMTSLVVSLGFMGLYFIRFFPNSAGLVQNASLASNRVTPLWSYSDGVLLKDYFSAFYSYNHQNQSLSSCVLFFFIIVGTWASDVGAYLFGMLFGKHRMSPRISPHKTWEGFFGGMFFSIAMTLGMAAILEYGFNIPVVPGLVQFHYSAALDSMGVLAGNAWVFLVLIAVCQPVVGNLGGFLFSLIKRQYGIKDYGTIFPGHGGVIDRFDSVLINCIVTSVLLVVCANGWRFVV